MNYLEDTIVQDTNTAPAAEAPAAGSTSEAPAFGSTFEAPAVGSTFEAPAAGSTFEAPAAGSTLDAHLPVQPVPPDTLDVSMAPDTSTTSWCSLLNQGSMLRGVDVPHGDDDKEEWSEVDADVDVEVEMPPMSSVESSSDDAMSLTPIGDEAAAHVANLVNAIPVVDIVQAPAPRRTAPAPIPSNAEPVVIPAPAPDGPISRNVNAARAAPAPRPAPKFSRKKPAPRANVNAPAPSANVNAPAPSANVNAPAPRRNVNGAPATGIVNAPAPRGNYSRHVNGAPAPRARNYSRPRPAPATGIVEIKDDSRPRGGRIIGIDDPINHRAIQRKSSAYMVPFDKRGQPRTDLLLYQRDSVDGVVNRLPLFLIASDQAALDPYMDLFFESGPTLDTRSVAVRCQFACNNHSKRLSYDPNRDRNNATNHIFNKIELDMAQFHIKALPTLATDSMIPTFQVRLDDMHLQRRMFRMQRIVFDKDGDWHQKVKNNYPDATPYQCLRLRIFVTDPRLRSKTFNIDGFSRPLGVHSNPAVTKFFNCINAKYGTKGNFFIANWLVDVNPQDRRDMLKFYCIKSLAHATGSVVLITATDESHDSAAELTRIEINCARGTGEHSPDYGDQHTLALYRNEVVWLSNASFFYRPVRKIEYGTRRVNYLYGFFFELKENQVQRFARTKWKNRSVAQRTANRNRNYN